MVIEVEAKNAKVRCKVNEIGHIVNALCMYSSAIHREYMIGKIRATKLDDEFDSVEHLAQSMIRLYDRCKEDKNE